MGAKSSVYDLEAKLPLGYNGMAVSEIVVDFEYINQSGNILIDVALNGKKAEKGSDGLYRFPVKPSDFRHKVR